VGQGEPLEVAGGDNDLPCPGCPAMPGPDRGLHAPGSGLCSEGGPCSTLPSSISRLLQLLEVQVPPSRRTTLEPVVDYTKSIIMTGDDYVKAIKVFSVFFGMSKFWHPKILARRYSRDTLVFNALKEINASYYGNPTAYFAAKASNCTKPSVEILATIITNFVPFLAILFVTFEYYRNLAPDC
jgi:hypothetical protein